MTRHEGGLDKVDEKLRSKFYRRAVCTSSDKRQVLFVGILLQIMVAKFPFIKVIPMKYSFMQLRSLHSAIVRRVRPVHG
jgi:hypothetical protein